MEDLFGKCETFFDYLTKKYGRSADTVKYVANRVGDKTAHKKGGGGECKVIKHSAEESENQYKYPLLTARRQTEYDYGGGKYEPEYGVRQMSYPTFAEAQSDGFQYIVKKSQCRAEDQRCEYLKNLIREGDVHII